MSERDMSRAPWSTEPSLKQKAQDLGVDFDQLIEEIKSDHSDPEIAKRLGITVKATRHLKNHFMTHGVGSIMGQD